MAKYKNIFKAIEANDVEAVKAFLPERLNARDKYGNMPLHTACYLKNIGIVRLLLENGADINAKENMYKSTALHLACRNNDIEMVRLLLDSGADINETDYNGCTPLFIACKKGYIETISLLLDRGADIETKDKYGYTPLYIVCHHRMHNVSEFLVKHGADPYVTDNYGTTALDCDDELIEDIFGNKAPHRQILLQLRAEYLNKPVMDKTEHTAALSSGWEMEI